MIFYPSRRFGAVLATISMTFKALAPSYGPIIAPTAPPGRSNGKLPASFVRLIPS